MSAPAANPVYASVAYFRIPDFGARAVSEQAALKDGLETRARALVEKIPAGERVVLDADDGIALVLFGEPVRALEATQALHAKPGEPALHVGLAYGPLALTTRSSDARVFGDGIASAAAAARFSSPEKILVTQDFAKVLEATAPEKAAELEGAGEFTDTQVRLHAFYTPDARRAVARRRRMAKLAAVGVVGILLLGVAAREGYRHLFPPLPAIVKLEVKPRGEVFVDGVSRGKIPPLTEVAIPAGKHVVQIRSPGHPPLELRLDLKAGEQMTIAHTFGKTEPQRGFFGELKKKFGW